MNNLTMADPDTQLIQQLQQKLYAADQERLQLLENMATIIKKNEELEEEVKDLKVQIDDQGREHCHIIEEQQDFIQNL